VSLFSLGSPPKGGLEKIEQSPKWQYPKHAMWDSKTTFHPKPFGWVWAPKHPNVNPQQPPQATLGQSWITNCNGPWPMVSGVNRPSYKGF